MVPKAQWLMHNASGWDWFLGFSYVSLSYIRDLDYLVASVLFSALGVRFWRPEYRTLVPLPYTVEKLPDL